MATIYIERRRNGNVESLRLDWKSGWKTVFRGPWPLIIGSVVLAVENAVVLYAGRFACPGSKRQTKSVSPKHSSANDCRFIDRRYYDGVWGADRVRLQYWSLFRRNCFLQPAWLGVDDWRHARQCHRRETASVCAFGKNE